MATTLQAIQYTLQHIVVEAYLQGIGEDTMPLHFTPGNKTQGNSPRIEKADGTVPDFLPQLVLGDNNATVLKKLEATINVFYAFRKFFQEKGKSELVYALETKGANGYMPEYETLKDAEQAISHYIEGYLTGRIMVKNVHTKPWTVAKEVALA